MSAAGATMTDGIDTGPAMKRARLELGFSQVEMARALGLGEQAGRNTIARLEKSHRIPGTYRLAVEALVERKNNAQG